MESNDDRGHMGLPPPCMMADWTGNLLDTLGLGLPEMELDNMTLDVDDSGEPNVDARMPFEDTTILNEDANSPSGIITANTEPVGPSKPLPFNKHAERTQDSLTLVNRISASKQKITCPICDLVMLKKTLPRHLRVKHTSARAALQCTSCDKTFSRRDIMERHVREQHNGEPGTVECMKCGKNVRERALQDHFRSNKCRKAQFAMLQDSHNASRVPRQLSLESMMDPLLVCLHSLVLSTLIWLHLDDLVPVEEGPLPLASPYLSQKAVAELWEVRGLAIRRIIKSLADPSVQDILNAQIFLLACTDSIIFGKRSESVKIHIESAPLRHPMLRPCEIADNLMRFLGAARGNAIPHALALGLEVQFNKAELSEDDLFDLRNELEEWFTTREFFGLSRR